MQTLTSFKTNPAAGIPAAGFVLTESAQPAPAGGAEFIVFAAAFFTKERTAVAADAYVCGIAFLFAISAKQGHGFTSLFPESISKIMLFMRFARGKKRLPFYSPLKVLCCIEMMPFHAIQSHLAGLYAIFKFLRARARKRFEFGAKYGIIKEMKNVAFLRQDEEIKIYV